MSSHDNHPEGVAHHFESAEQQFDSGKFGIWTFLLTEVLFFSALFVAYTMYRDNYPEVFQFASQYLDTNLGALNTLV
ncbi:MAG: cytochrome c oxidase subunit 3 family protein, partial [Planctomycetes bacterium]|nr:cytochrome c oxidase subunit 3 family protein [Planctomycetota bacterium]